MQFDLSWKYLVWSPQSCGDLAVQIFDKQWLFDLPSVVFHLLALGFDWISCRHDRPSNMHGLRLLLSQRWRRREPHLYSIAMPAPARSQSMRSLPKSIQEASDAYLCHIKQSLYSMAILQQGYVFWLTLITKTLTKQNYSRMDIRFINWLWDGWRTKWEHTLSRPSCSKLSWNRCLM